MDLGMQDLIALGAVTVSAGYLLRRGWLVFARRRGGCGSCGSCPQSSAEGQQIVAISLPPK